MSVRVVSRWFGAFELEGSRLLRQELVPLDPREQVLRFQARLRGERTREEDAILADPSAPVRRTPDRRLVVPGVSLGGPNGAPEASEVGVNGSARQAVFLAVAEHALADSWDPSIHLEEAVRAMTDLDSVRNLVGERLASWASRDLLAPDDGGEAGAEAAGAVLAGRSASDVRAPPTATLQDARRSLAELYSRIAITRRELERAIEETVPARTPNLEALLGPALAARMISQAGGLARLGRLPASTVQVLGAEKAFFDHLRGRAPPPRHGLLFLHPTIQSSPRRQRGKLARALAGKVAIAARLDLAGAAVVPALRAAYESRRGEIRERAARPGRTDRKPRRPPRTSSST